MGRMEGRWPAGKAQREDGRRVTYRGGGQLGWRVEASDGGGRRGHGGFGQPDGVLLFPPLLVPVLRSRAETEGFGGEERSYRRYL